MVGGPWILPVLNLHGVLKNTYYNNEKWCCGKIWNFRSKVNILVTLNNTELCSNQVLNLILIPDVYEMEHV